MKNNIWYEGALDFYPGMQIVYIPDHAKENHTHPDIQFGFIEKVGLDRCLCRYWQKGGLGQLRTTANGEWTKKDDFYICTSVDQKVVDKILLNLKQSEK